MENVFIKDFTGSNVSRSTSKLLNKSKAITCNQNTSSESIEQVLWTEALSSVFQTHKHFKPIF